MRIPDSKNPRMVDNKVNAVSPGVRRLLARMDMRRAWQEIHNPWWKMVYKRQSRSYGITTHETNCKICPMVYSRMCDSSHMANCYQCAV